MSKRIPYPGLSMHFYEFPRGTHDGPRAAIVAYYWPDDDCVNLTVLDPHGSTYGVQGVQVVNPGDDAPQKSHYVEFIDEEAKTADQPAEVDGNMKPNVTTSNLPAPPNIADKFKSK
jgi:hypothetical protein